MRRVLQSSRARYGLGLTAGLVLLALIPAAIAQTRRPAAAPPMQAAMRAFIEGRYDEIASLTAALDQQDPNVAALNARAEIARGKYQEADARLRPIAQRAPTSEAALQLGLLLHMLRRPEAASILTRVAAAPAAQNDAQALARSARALWALGRFQDANSMYRDASAAAPKDAAINTAWGDLFLEKYNKPDAMKSYQMALDEDPKWEPAILGSARALADEDPPQAIALARQALAINPSDVGAYLVVAGEAAGDARHRDEARQALQKALAVNPSSLGAHALLAALAYVEDKDAEYQAEVAKTLAIAPGYGEAYRVVAELTAQNYRFDEAAAVARRALEIDPDNAQTLSDLSLDLLRTGDEVGARQALSRSLNIDDFDDKLRPNLEKMMDRLDKFTTIHDGDITLRMSADEAPVMQDDVMALAHKALDALAKRYDFTPKGPFLIEVFPKHEDFAVRIAGLPGMIGALGACFGRVVSMDSPRAPILGPFQWEATLWHELAHVITLQMSNQRIPRWLTEGISVYEQKMARPEWARVQDMEFAGAIGQNEVTKLKDLNDSFQNPKLISISYFEASLLVDHIVQTFGDAGLHKLIRAYARGVDTDAALKAELGTSLEEMQPGFDRYLDQRFGAVARALAAPKDEKDNSGLLKMSPDELKKYADDHKDKYVPQLVLGDALRKAGDLDGAVQAFSRAAALVPLAVGLDSPHAQMADIAIERKDRPRAMAELRALLNTDFENLDAARKLASAMKADGVSDAAQLRPAYERIAALNPFDADARTMLGRFALQRNDPEAASREFKVVLALNPVDAASAHADLADSYLRSGKRAEAKKETLAALEIAPTYERAQDLLLRLAENRH
jgi:Flp pilus assembly protein TadD